MVFCSAMTGPLHVVFTEVAKRYDLRVVFKGVSGEARPHQVLVLTGPNGSGKSTLLRILCGLLRPSRGTVQHLCDGREVPRDEWRQHLGVVAPAMSVYEELDAMENLLFFARIRGVAEPDERCRRALTAVGLDPQRTTPVRGFSTGMLQRLKIAQALLHEPPLLLLDEPGSNLDPGGQDWLESQVRSLAEAGKTIILATNDRREMEWGDHHVTLPG
jgi:heme exporter protein A